MDYMRKIVNSDVLSGVFDIPESLRNRKVEILVIPYEQKNDEIINATENPDNARGMLRQYRKSSLISQEDGAWAEAVAEKYEGS